MTVDLICPGCGRKLRIATTPTTQSARCPSCSALFDVTGTDPVASGNDPHPAPSSGWMVRIPEGLTYGPVSMDLLETWIAQQRVTAECQLRQEGTSTWLSADALFPQLRPVVHRSTPVPGAAAGSGPAVGSMPPRVFRGGTVARSEPHRGALVLALGILSWVSCPLFGVFAWMLGNADLRRMELGQMDPSGRELTQVGRILGMVHLLLMFAVFAILVPLFLLFGVVLH